MVSEKKKATTISDQEPWSDKSHNITVHQLSFGIKIVPANIALRELIPPKDFVSINYSIHIYILKVFAKSISDNIAVHRFNFGIKIVLRS